MIQIPGYKILRQLGRGGMATVYLALQESVDREVALKVMSPQLLVDPNFGERFLREAKIAAKLHHRHVVGVHDVGRHGDIYYMAMEFVSGGPVVKKDGEPLEVQIALRATREIATALAYAHSKGFVHRDVKPDNMLTREDGSAVLTDFGIARANDSATRMTRTGSVVGTPHYMSPEQARGRQIDGRADLYSLGIVLYELLMGRVPYMADDSLAVGIMHITQPVPQLPEPLTALQPLLDKLLAKTPEERIQSGEVVAEEIRKLELKIAEGVYPTLAKADAAWRNRIAAESKLAVARTVQVDAMTQKNADRVDSREGPSIGSTKDLNLTDKPRTSEAAPKSKSMVLPAVAAVALLLAGGGYVFRDKLGLLIPEPALNQTLNQAEAALQAGKLAGTAESARELFESVLRGEPDNERAKEGIKAVGSQLLEQSRTAMRANDLNKASDIAKLAREVLGGSDALVALEQSIDKARASTSELSDDLAAAEAAFKSDKLVGGDDSAWAIYLRVLDADMTNSIALSGQQKILEQLTKRARLAIDSGDLVSAQTRIGEIEALSQNATGLTDLKAALGDAQNKQAQKKTSLIEEADRLLAQGKLIEGGRNAESVYREVLALEPQSADAKRGLNAVAFALGTRAMAALERKETAKAANDFQAAKRLGWNNPEARAFEKQLREAQEKMQIDLDRASGTGTVDTAQIEKLLAQADAAMNRGDLFQPPNECAFDLFKQVQRLQFNNDKAKSGLRMLPEKAKSLFEQALAANQLPKAAQYLDGVKIANGRDAAINGMQVQLSNAWLKQAETRLTQNQPVEARRALDYAKRVNPSNPGIAAVEAKLAGAQ